MEGDKHSATAEASNGGTCSLVLSWAASSQWMWQGSYKENIRNIIKDWLMYHIGAVLIELIHFPTFEYLVLQLHPAIMYYTCVVLCSNLSATGNNVSSVHVPDLNYF